MHHIELLAIREKKRNGLAVCLRPKLPLITPSIAQDIRRLQNQIAERYYKKPWNGVYIVIWYLHAQSLPWQGLDFQYIYHSLKHHHEREIEQYIKNIFELLFINYTGFGLPIVNCSFVNRKLSGISQDFFYLNRINFIKQTDLKPTDKLNHFTLDQKNISFPDTIYQRNYYYAFHVVNLLHMQEIISTYQFAPISIEEQEAIKSIFDKIQKDTLERIYQLAACRINIFKRFAEIQTKNV